MVEQLEARHLLATFAADFDGVASYVSASNPLVGASEFTVEAWVRRPAGAKGGAVIASGPDSTFWFGILNNNRVYLRTGLPAIDYLGTSPFDTSAWTHIAATYAQNEFTTLYINGQADQVLPSHDDPLGWDQRLSIGAAPFENGLITDAFIGNVSGLRIWNFERSAEQIRQTMTMEISEPRPGLVANFPFSQDLGDLVSGTLGQANGAARRVFVTPPSPPERPVAQVDKEFATLTDGLSAAATAYVPDLDQAILAGGFSDNVPTSEITSVDAATGMTQTIGQIGSPRTYASAAYASSTGKVYVFGGTGNGTSRLVEEIDPLSGARRSLPSLPLPISKSAAVYHPTLDRIYLFGGHDDQNTVNTNVMIFDVASGDTSIAPFSLPFRLASTAAVYSPTDDAIYLFGGSRSGFAHEVNSYLDRVIRIDATTSGGTANLLPLRLQERLMGASAVFDSSSRLIYLVGGVPNSVGMQDRRAVAFDPETEQLWETASEQTERYYASVIYSQRQRHVLQIGGNARSSLGGQADITRIPLGDGPVVPLEHWDFPAVIPGVNDIAGDDQKVLFGTQNAGLVTLTADTSSAGLSQQTTSSTVLLAPGSAVTDVAYDSANDTTVLAIRDAGARIVRQNLVTRVDTTQPGFNTNRVYDAVVDPSGVIFYATDSGIKWLIPGTSTYQTSGFTGHHFAIANRGRMDEVWSLYTVGSNEFRQHGLYRMLRNRNGFVRDEFYTLPGVPFTGNEDGQQLEFDEQGNFWIRRGTAVTYIPAGEIPNMALARSYNEVLGNPVDLTVDGDNRVWSALTPVLGSTAVGTARSGGITAREQQSSQVAPTTGDWNWLNAPLGTNQLVTYFNQGVQRGADAWSSSVTAVAGVHEKLWLSQPNGNVVSYAPRWSQLDDHNDLGDRHVDHVWTVRGRLFVASLDRAGQNPMLSVLQPDGKTWDNRPGIRAHSLHGDSQGRIWVGTSEGVRLYEVNGGWDLLTDRIGVAPTGPIPAIAEDLNGRIWIASGQGLTLFDRDRFVTTLTSTNSGLPNARINSLYVDSTDTLWIGTEAGLASLRGTTVSVFTTQNGLPDQRIADIASIASGELILSTPTGLVAYSGTRFRRETLPAGLNSNAPPLAVDEYGRLWAGNGLRKAQDDWQGHWATNSGLRTSSVTDVAFDGAGRIWFAHGAAGGVSVRSNFLPPLPDTIPVITSVTPTSARYNDVITIRGEGFGSSDSDLEVTIGGERVRPASVTNTAIQVKVTASMISGVVSVVRKGRRAIADERFCAIPTIDGFTPSGGSFGTMVEINGKNFDPGANARLGNGSLRFTAPAKDQPSLRAQKITTTILPGDSDGRITVHNGCGPSAQSADIFNLVTGFRGNIHVTQGYDGLPLVTNKPTAIYSYLDATDWGPNDTVEVDAVRVRFRAPDGRESMVTRPYTPPKPMSGEEPKTPRSPTAGNARIPAEAIGVFNVYPTISGPVSVQTELMRRGYVVNRLPARTMYFHPNRDLTALFVPIMKEGYTAAELRAFKADIESRSYEASQRLMPQGQVRIVWSNEVMTSRDPIDAGDDISFVKSMFDVQRIRNAYNTNLFGTRADFGIGILHRNLTTVPQTADGVALGLGLTKFPTLEKIGAAASVALDSLCDSLVKAANTISFGLIGSRDGCNIEVPVGTSWVVGSSSVISKTLAHEIGHLLGLVAADAANGDANHNSSHSKNDEFFSVAGCKTYQAGPPHDVNLSRSIYTQLGASGPFINPIHGMIYPFPSLGSKPSDKHAKAIMSYACERNNDNSFFEPADVARLGFSVAPFFINAANAPRPAIPAAVPAAGPRLTVAGTINLESGEGDMPVVRPISELTPLSVSFVSNYQLVQLDAQGRELHRVGILPSLSVKDGGDHGADDALSNVAQFAANVQRHANVARIELRDGDRVLDTFVASRNAPTVRIVSSPSGMVTSDFVSIQWNASDPDGDSLEAMIEASHDQGITWKPVASGAGSGVARIPADVLDGGTWQLRVTATDGFNSSSVTSTSFSLAEQQPRVFIGELSSQESLEGRLVSFVGGVANEDRVAGNLVWSSDRDGWLGEGTSIETFLSVGRHRITLTALSQSGLPTSFTIEHVVVPDYDGDGITDDREFQLELHPLDGRDAFTDRDGDGLSEIGEILYGLNRNSVDTDGDGRSDGDEVRLGSNPWAADAAPTATMEVYPASLNLEADLALDIPLPQDQLMVVWNAPGTRTWNVSSDVPWLVTSSIDQVFEGTGMTPVHVLMQAFDLADGVHTGTITVRSSSPDAGTPVLVREVPVQVTVRNRLAYFDVNRDGTTDSADIQAIRAREGVDVSSPDYDYRLDVNRDGRITTADSALWDSASSRPTVADIDRLMAAIRANDGSFDLTGDGRINLDDLQYMVKIRARTFFGDANLDGRFDSADLVQVFQRGHYENRQSPIVGWGEGDWNADGRFDSSDLVAAFQDGGYLRSARHHALADWTELELDIDPRDGLLTL